MSWYTFVRPDGQELDFSVDEDDSVTEAMIRFGAVTAFPANMPREYLKQELDLRQLYFALVHSVEGPRTS